MRVWRANVMKKLAMQWICIIKSNFKLVVKMYYFTFERH
ncbi:hypothetical protein phiOC_p173 [Ochrobactrum phage vB_OspM_OC]|nr:hypothetical protein phiOC_p173 [Ochrobactrum phage vB_OspM_OC]